MKRFQFPLQTLLRYRTLLEERRREELSQCLAREGRAREHLEELMLRLDSLTSPPISAQGDLSWWGLTAQYREQVRLLAVRGEAELKRAQEQTRKARTAWQEARTQVRLVARLREKAYRIWEREADREAQNLADDLFLARRPSGEKP